MRDIYTTNGFEKDLKKVKTYPNFKANRLKDYIELLAGGNELPANARNHKLSKASPKEYQGLYDFHVSPDICVIYKIDDSSVVMVRIGKHNNLGLTEDMLSE